MDIVESWQMGRNLLLLSPPNLWAPPEKQPERQQQLFHSLIGSRLHHATRLLSRDWQKPRLSVPSHASFVFPPKWGHGGRRTAEVLMSKGLEEISSGNSRKGSHIIQGADITASTGPPSSFSSGLSLSLKWPVSTKRLRYNVSSKWILDKYCQSLHKSQLWKACNWYLHVFNRGQKTAFGKA